MLFQAPDPPRGRHDLRLRLAVWRGRARLDAALAEGRDPADDPALALRAVQLTKPSTRLALASTIRNLIDAAEEPPEAWSGGDCRPPLQRQALLAAHDDLQAIADRLGRAGDIPPQAAALGASLVWDSASPMYATNADTSVASVAHAVIRALDARASARD